MGLNGDGLRSLADFGAGWVLWLLVALSVLALAIVLERALFLYRTRSNKEGVPLGDDVDVTELAAQLAEQRGFEAEVLRAGLMGRRDLSVAERRMSAVLRRLQKEASKRLSFLGTVGANAPFIGLLGTVIGIVRAFRELDASRGQVTAGLMSEVGEALIATAVGILVAIPAVAAYNAFQQIIQARLDQAEASSQDLLACLAWSQRHIEGSSISDESDVARTANGTEPDRAAIRRKGAGHAVLGARPEGAA